MSYLSSLGGKDVTAMTNNILRKILTNELGCMYSFWGKRSNKRPFADLKLKSSVVGNLCLLHVLYYCNEDRLMKGHILPIVHTKKKILVKLFYFRSIFFYFMNFVRSIVSHRNYCPFVCL